MNSSDKASPSGVRPDVPRAAGAAPAAGDAPATPAAIDPATSPLGAAEFEALLDATVDAIVVIDDRGIILRFNKAAEKLLGFTAAEAVGQSMDIMMAGEDPRRHRQYVSNYLRTGRKRIIGLGREVLARHKDGSTFPVALAVGEVKLGERTRFVGLMRDLSDQKAAEQEALRHREEMMHASRLTVMGEMAAAMAHEINQPLSAIATYTAACSRLLDQGPEGVDEVRGVLGRINEQAHRAGDVIRRIRNFTRSRELSRRTTSVEALVEEIRPLVEMDAKANSVQLDILVDDDLPEVTVDTIQIQQVLLNLFRNGVDAMADNPPEDRVLRLHATADGSDGVRLAITDRGHGVGEEAGRQLFTPFFTTKAGGMGMGLAISRSIIAAHGGRLDWTNNENGGTTFTVLLPTSLEDSADE